MPWTHIDWSTAKKNLESMYNREVESAMMNSYARTTMLNWIQDMPSGNYQDTFWGGGNLDNTSVKGNYYACNYFEEIRSRGSN